MRSSKDTMTTTTDRPGGKWRLLAHDQGDAIEVENRGIFDELVVDEWLHIENLDTNAWWLRVGDARVIVTITPGAPPTVDIERGFYEATNGTTRLSDG